LSTFSALTLLFGHQEGPLACKKIEWWDTGMIICRSEVQVICIWSSWCHCHPIISCSPKIQNGLPFWCRLTQVVLEKRPLNECSVVVLFTTGHFYMCVFFKETIIIRKFIMHTCIVCEFKFFTSVLSDCVVFLRNNVDACMCQREACLWHSVQLPWFQCGRHQTRAGHCRWNSPSMGRAEHSWSTTETGRVLCILGTAASARHWLGIVLVYFYLNFDSCN